MSKFLLLILILSFSGIFLLPMVSEAVLVPCGLSQDYPGNDIDERKPCTACDLFKLVKNVADYVLTRLLPIVATALFIVAGLVLMFGGASTKAHAWGKQVFKNTAIGILIISSAWLITNTILKILAGDSDVAKEWYKIECVDPRSPTGGIQPSTGPVSTQVKSLAQGILDAGIPLDTRGDCSNHHPQENIQDMAAGRYPYVCSPSCDCRRGGTSGTVTVHPWVLQKLTELNSKHPKQFKITSLTTGKHSATSDHYKGRGVDIVPLRRDAALWKSMRDFLSASGGRAFCETRGGASDATCASSDHIHWSYY